MQKFVLSPQALSDLFAVVDDDRSGTIDMREFEILAAGGVAAVAGQS